MTTLSLILDIFNVLMWSLTAALIFLTHKPVGWFLLNEYSKTTVNFPEFSVNDISYIHPYKNPYILINHMTKKFAPKVSSRHFANV